MATNAPLLGKEKKGHSKASIFYGADEYLEVLKKKCLEQKSSFGIEQRCSAFRSRRAEVQFQVL